VSDAVTLGGSYSYLQDYIDLVMQMDRKAFCSRVTAPVLVSETRKKPLSFGAGVTLTTDGAQGQHLLHLGHKQQVFEIRARKPDPLGQIMLGRMDECDLVVADDTISSRHAAFQQDRESGTFQVKDLSSRNGTKVNGNQVDPAKTIDLTNGDNLLFGDVAFVFFKPEGLYDALESSYKKSR